MTPSFFSIGDSYFATIRSGWVEDIITENGRNKKFPSATLAMSAAIKEIESRRQIILPPPMETELPKEPDIVESWRKGKLRQRIADREMATLLGVEVVTIKKRKIVKK